MRNLPVIVTLRRLLVLTGLLGGLILTFFSLDQLEAIFGRFNLPLTIGVLALGGALGGLIAAMVAPVVARLEARLHRMPVVDIVFGTVGLVAGLIVANLLASSLAHIPWVGAIMGALGGLIFGYLGISIAAKKREELSSAFAGLLRVGRGDKPRSGDAAVVAAPSGPPPKILDTSVIIDGRIADVCQTGFLEGPLVIPGFVLEELRRIADSADALKRNRGRRGLDVLARIRNELALPVQVLDRDGVGPGEVDDKLIRLARQLGGKVVTNDYNLNKVAGLQGVPVLNINELANALKPVVLPGEEMSVHIIRDGKEAGQGVGYLDDGTMIVIEGGKRHIGDTIGVLVTSVLQTSAGRMIFAKPKAAERAAQ